METLKEYNDRINIVLAKGKNYTGISCPNCNEEMQYKQPGIYMISNPMQSDVICYNCNYSTRIRVV